MFGNFTMDTSSFSPPGDYESIAKPDGPIYTRTAVPEGWLFENME